jgi:hypothetical protein
MEHQAAASLGRAIQAMSRIYKIIRPSAPPSEEQKKRLGELQEVRIQRLDEFRKAAVATVGARL